MTGRARSRTRATLWWLCGAGLALAVLATGFALLALARVHDTAETARTRTVPATVEVAAARAAVVSAYRGAVESIRDDAAPLTGPGEDYRGQIAAASQNLAQAAEDNVAGTPGSQLLRLIEGQLVAFSGSMEQAAAGVAGDGANPLAIADLWYAADLLHQSGAGILDQLDELRDGQRAELGTQLRDGAATLTGALWWTVPALLLFGLLLGALWYVNHRFRRGMCPEFVLSLLLLAVLVYAGSRAWAADADLRHARDLLDERTAVWEFRTWQTDAMGQRALRAVVDGHCSSERGECGPTALRWVRLMPLAPPLENPDDNRWLTTDSDQITRAFDVARGYGDHRWLILGSGLLVAIASTIGFQRRLNEYRYRS